MKMLFAQLCKLYTFFLVAFATIAVGAPLENEIMNPNLKRANIELTLPYCPADHPVYKASLCNSITELMVYCGIGSADDPATTIISYMNCKPDEVCVEHYHAVESELDVPHATCTDTKNKWDNFDNPNAIACSGKTSYISGSKDIEIAIIIYASDGKPIQVDSLYATENDSMLYPINNNMHNYTNVLRNYNKETIQYCFHTGTYADVTAYATAWGISV
ncbi:10554_t:CDS:1 [Funneliformis geosporum]|uniref:8556_t:CDS:1 n=1 Tax=Funneliformis geosporum TaxID=1117311 RepID=A0A9W4WJ86_9GLOM|nr:8556_t:CDS:1 [Funneliformis geosporum]CAI2176577.1 10554_t:CDS:1 [Funneliformis geosporum]